MSVSIIFYDLQKDVIKNVSQFTFDNDFLTLFVESDEVNEFGQPVYVKKINYSRLEIGKVWVKEV